MLDFLTQHQLSIELYHLIGFNYNTKKQFEYAFLHL